ncbi:MAG: hypothetical protein OEY59_01115 [Deltaproteobacteria bacterium]|nr:hypothetical protein [Deltaproteobacteria bacterium]
MFKNIINSIPPETLKALTSITKTYHEAGYQCYLVGGSLRDLLLGEMPCDFDFTTDAPLDVTKRLFKRVIPVGESHGTLSILLNRQSFEITRFRRDIQTFGRKAIVEFGTSIEEDLLRRDLRINAMAYDILGNRLIDTQGGVKDIEDKLIRFVGDATIRIKEDHLRAVRFVRLVAKTKPLGFTFDNDEMRKVIKTFDSSYLSVERIYLEFQKMFIAQTSDFDFLFSYLHELGLFSRFFKNPSIARLVLLKVIKSKSLLPLFYNYREFHSLKETAKDLKISKLNQKQIELVREFEQESFTTPESIKRLIFRGSSLELNFIIEAFHQIRGLDLSGPIQQVLDSNEPILLKDIEIDAMDLVSLNFPAKIRGTVLKLLLVEVWKNPAKNEKEWLVTKAQELLISLQ